MFSALSVETSAGSGAVISEMKGLYILPVELVSARFSCTNAIHTYYVTAMSLLFTIIDSSGGSDATLEHLSVRLSELYGPMPVLDIKLRQCGDTGTKE